MAARGEVNSVARVRSKKNWRGRGKEAIFASRAAPGCRAETRLWAWAAVFAACKLSAGAPVPLRRRNAPHVGLTEIALR